ncbi:MAG: isoprenylcysteine carboxylmethyltransferase family protein [Candidatus Falkowbacteria bacterium]
MHNLNLASFNAPELQFSLIASLLVGLCVLAVLFAVLIDFVEFQKRVGAKKERKSMVETGSMLFFLLLFYFLLGSGFGRISLSISSLKVSLVILGLIILIVGAFVNIKGRFDLGRNWANQIKIYNDHSLVIVGAYRLIRHPLYSSIIWMFFGASLVYLNYLACLFNLLIFIPMMYCRAKQEENLLSKEFPGYKDYQEKTGMFFPRLFK